MSGDDITSSAEAGPSDGPKKPGRPLVVVVFFVYLQRRVGHPENCLFLLSKKIFSGSEYPQKYFISF